MSYPADPTDPHEILRKEGDEGTPELPVTAPPPAYSIQINIIDNESNAPIGHALSSQVHRAMLDDNAVFATLLSELGGLAYRRAFVDARE